MVNRKNANNQVNMADLRLSANILFAQSIREKENSKRTLLFEPYHKISDYYAFTAAISYLKF